MKITYYGHACIGVEVCGKHLLFDPFITGNSLASAVKVEEVPADLILVSHGHGDHVGDAITISKRTGAAVVAGFEVAEWLRKQGAPKIVHMNHGGATAFPFGRVKFVNAVHSSSMPDGSYGGHPGGWVIESPEGNFYFSGDTALTYDMKWIGEDFNLKFAALCIGDHFTMGVWDAIRAADWVGVQQVVGIHFDTFPPIAIDHADAIAKFQAAGKTLHLLPIGQSVDLP
jgi:L-ascorbate metabolism protein UlaG (beta-lactamase superfamily)